MLRELVELVIVAFIYIMAEKFLGAWSTIFIVLILWVWAVKMERWK